MCVGQICAELRSSNMYIWFIVDYIGLWLALSVFSYLIYLTGGGTSWLGQLAAGEEGKESQNLGREEEEEEALVAP